MAFRDYRKALEYQKQYRKRNKEILLSKKKEYYLKRRIEILKKRRIFYEKNRLKIGLYNKGLYERTKSRHKLLHKIYYQENKVRLQALMKQYQIKNKVKIASIRRSYEKKRRKENIQFRLAQILRTRISDLIRRKPKTGSAVRDLGCNLNELKFYLEGQFKDGMSWDNWGRDGWHIDHVVPLAYFDLTNREQFLQACHYTNLQPLWARENYSKGHKLLVGVKPQNGLDRP